MTPALKRQCAGIKQWTALDEHHAAGEFTPKLFGTNVTECRPAMEQGSQSLLSKMESERLQGLDTQFITEMGEHRKAYVGRNGAQGATESTAQTQRLKRDALIESIKDFRIEIQYAIDAEYGPGDPANAPARREFDLPVNRPFNAAKRKGAQVGKNFFATADVGFTSAVVSLRDLQPRSC